MDGRRVSGTITFEAGKHRVRVRIEGKQETLGRYDTLEEAEGVLAAWLEKHGQGTGALTLGVWGQRWLDRREREGQHRDVKGDRSRWRAHIEGTKLASIPLRRVESTDVARWARSLVSKPITRTKTTGRGANKKTERIQIEGETLGRQTISNALNLLRACLTDAVIEGKCATNVARGIPVPKVKGKKKSEPWTWLRQEEIDAVAACTDIPDRARLVYIICAYTGVRPGELWGLLWRDVHLRAERPYITVRFSRDDVTKTELIREVPLLPAALAAFRRWQELAPGVGAALVFPADDGRCHRNGYDAGWPTHKLLAGIRRRARFYDLRHTCASHLVQGSWGRVYTLEEVRVWLGHESIETTMRYAHLCPDALHGAAAATPGPAKTQDVVPSPRKRAKAVHAPSTLSPNQAQAPLGPSRNRR